MAAPTPWLCVLHVLALPVLTEPWLEKAGEKKHHTNSLHSPRHTILSQPISSLSHFLSVSWLLGPHTPHQLHLLPPAWRASCLPSLEPVACKPDKNTEWAVLTLGLYVWCSWPTWFCEQWFWADFQLPKITQKGFDSIHLARMNGSWDVVGGNVALGFRRSRMLF